MKYSKAYFDHIGYIRLPIEVAKACSHPGPCDNDVKRCIELPEIIAEMSGIEPEALRRELKEYGAWTDDQLSDHSVNLERILWIAACDINEESKDSEFNEIV